MSNNIVTGCRAVIVNSKAGNDGIVVTVGKYIGEVKGYEGEHRYEVDRDVMTAFGRKANHMDEYQLKRLPDDPKLSSWEAVQEQTGWNPIMEPVKETSL